MSAAARPGAAELVQTLLDTGSYVSWDAPVDSAAYGANYRLELAAARDRAGTDEAVITGRGRLRGRDVAVIISELIPSTTPATVSTSTPRGRRRWAG